MNKKITLFFCIVVLLGSYSYSQESFDEHDYLESTPSDQPQESLDLGALDDNQLHQEHTLSTDDNYEHSEDDLRAIAEHEANHDLVNVADITDIKNQPNLDQSVTKNDDASASTSEETPIIEGIDTVDLDQPQGNWLFKRIWWERSEERYEKIKRKIEEIFEKRMVFFEKRSELVKNILDPFYLKIGMGQGEFQAIVGEFIQLLETEREKKGSLSAQEREVLANLDNEREALEQLMVDVQAIGEVENRVDESLSQLLQQINAIRMYDKQAWDAFKEIARVVDDEKALQLYHVVDTALHNIKDIGDYLEHAFAAHFDQLIATAKEQTERVTTVVAGLKEKGINFKKRIEQIMTPKQNGKKVQEKKEEEEEPEEEQSFLSAYIMSPLASVWNGIVSVVSWPYYAIFGGKEAEESEEE